MGTITLSDYFAAPPPEPPEPARVRSLNTRTEAALALGRDFHTRLRAIRLQQHRRPVGEALAALPSVLGDIERLRCELRDAMPPGAARAQFDRQSAAYRDLESRRLTRHAETQRARWWTQGSDRLLRLLILDAADHASDPAAFLDLEKAGEAEIRGHGQRTTQPDTAVQARLARFRHLIATTVLNRLLDQDPLAANAFFNRHRALIASTGHPAAEHRLKTRLAAEAARLHWAAVQHGLTPPPLDEGEARTILDHRRAAKTAAAFAARSDAARHIRDTLLRAALDDRRPIDEHQLCALDPAVRAAWDRAPAGIRDNIRAVLLRNARGEEPVADARGEPLDTSPDSLDNTSIDCADTTDDNEDDSEAPPETTNPGKDTQDQPPPKDITDPMNGGAASAESPSANGVGSTTANLDTTAVNASSSDAASNDALSGGQNTQNNGAANNTPPQGHIVPKTEEELAKIAAAKGDNGYLAQKIDKDTGNGTQCAPLVKYFIPELGSTKTWKPGDGIKGPNDPPLQPGTAIASFTDGQYKGVSGQNHAAIFLGYANNPDTGQPGIRVFDQYDGKPAGGRFIPFDPSASGHGYTAGQFSVIR